MKKTIGAVVWVVATLVVASAASAHVTLQPSEVPAGGFTRLDVRVPNETDNAGTTKVEVQFPPGFESVSTEPVPGWTAVVKKGQEVDTVTWTGNGRTGIVKPGEFQDFGLSLATPDKPGTKLTFKALQTYDDGEVVRWIGPPDAEEPAPQVTLTQPTETATATPADTTEEEDDDDGAPVWLVIVALALGGLGLVAGVAGLVRRR